MRKRDLSVSPRTGNEQILLQCNFFVFPIQVLRVLKSLSLCQLVTTPRKPSASDYTRAVAFENTINTRSTESFSCVVSRTLLFLLAPLARLEPAPLPIPAARVGLPQ
jgi:hypothetical protein